MSGAVVRGMEAELRRLQVEQALLPRPHIRSHDQDRAVTTCGQSVRRSVSPLGTGVGAEDGATVTFSLAAWNGLLPNDRCPACLFFFRREGAR